MSSKKEKYVAFLRGINVGGHHKVPMVELKKELGKLHFENVVTILNSGNILFDATPDDLEKLEKTISEQLQKTFGFPIPTIIRRAGMMEELLANNPFKDIPLTKDIRLYVSFLKKDTETDLSLPWTNDDRSFTIIDKRDQTILSVLDLAVFNTPKGMEALERNYGKDITTRNWKTIQRIGKKLEASR